jgi:hypothetical protein
MLKLGNHAPERRCDFGVVDSESTATVRDFTVCSTGLIPFNLSGCIHRSAPVLATKIILFLGSKYDIFSKIQVASISSVY